MGSRTLQSASDLRPAERAYERLFLLLRGLAHDIRTPLSVISNELSYLSSEERPLRGLARCREIAELLRRLQAPRLAALEPLELEACLAQLELTAPPGCAGLRLAADPEMLRYCLSLIALLMPAARPELALDAARTRITLRYTEPLAPEAHRCARRAASFTDYFCRQCDLDRAAPPLIDAVLDVHRAEIEIEAQTELSAAIGFMVT